MPSYRKRRRNTTKLRLKGNRDTGYSTARIHPEKRGVAQTKMAHSCTYLDNERFTSIYVIVCYCVFLLGP